MRQSSGSVPIHQTRDRVSGGIAVVAGQAIVDLADRGVVQGHHQRRRRDGDGVVDVLGQGARHTRCHRRGAAWQAVVAGLVDGCTAIEHIGQRDGFDEVVGRDHARRVAGHRAEVQVLALHQVAQDHITQGGRAIVDLGGRQRQRPWRDHAIAATDGAARQAVVAGGRAFQADAGQ